MKRPPRKALTYGNHDAVLVTFEADGTASMVHHRHHGRTPASLITRGNPASFVLESAPELRFGIVTYLRDPW